MNARLTDAKTRLVADVEAWRTAAADPLWLGEGQVWSNRTWPNDERSKVPVPPIRPVEAGITDDKVEQFCRDIRCVVFGSLISDVNDGQSALGEMLSAFEGGFLPETPWSVSTKQLILPFTTTKGILVFGHHDADKTECAYPLIIDLTAWGLEDSDVGVPFEYIHNTTRETQTYRLECVGHGADVVRHADASWTRHQNITILGPAYRKEKWVRYGQLVHDALSASPTVPEPVGSEGSFIPSFKDKRPVVVIDRTGGSYAHYHDEVRCMRCNQRVLFKFPVGNTVRFWECPDCRGPVIIDHLAVPNLEMGGEQDEDVLDEPEPFVRR